MTEPIEGDVETREGVRVPVASTRGAFRVVDHRRFKVPPVFSGDRGPLDTPPCFSLPPADPERFSRGDHDG
jgi:hypothetical protein